MSKLTIEQLEFGRMYRGMSYHGERIVCNIIFEFKGKHHAFPNGLDTFVWDDLDNFMKFRPFGSPSMLYTAISKGSTSYIKYYERVDEYIASGKPCSTHQLNQLTTHFPIF